MRPPEFTGGNLFIVFIDHNGNDPASMRPPEFTGGNGDHQGGAQFRYRRRFNEAAGIHRRKPTGQVLTDLPLSPASMRPPEFTGGNFNPGWLFVVFERASMRPPEFTGGNRERNLIITPPQLLLQ